MGRGPLYPAGGGCSSCCLHSSPSPTTPAGHAQPPPPGHSPARSGTPACRRSSACSESWGSKAGGGAADTPLPVAPPYTPQLGQERLLLHPPPPPLPGLGDVHRHGGCRRDQATDHTGTEVAQNVVPEVACGQQGGAGGAADTPGTLRQGALQGLHRHSSSPGWACEHAPPPTLLGRDSSGQVWGDKSRPGHSWHSWQAKQKCRLSSRPPPTEILDNRGTSSARRASGPTGTFPSPRASPQQPRGVGPSLGLPPHPHSSSSSSSSPESRRNCLDWE